MNTKEKKDVNELETLKALAHDGFCCAQHDVGCLLIERKQYRDALDYLEMASSQGCGKSSYNIALIHGKIFKCDVSAKKWLEIASKQNFEKANILLKRFK